jgi:hypothetical protein
MSRAVLACAFITLSLSLIAAEMDPCQGKPLLIVPLDSGQQSFEARPVSGLTVIVRKDRPGWEVQVFRVTDTNHQKNLLYPAGNWHGAFPCQVQPSVAPETLPSPRLIPVRTSKASVCLRLVSPRVQSTGLEASFSGGSLEIVWVGG